MSPPLESRKLSESTLKLLNKQLRESFSSENIIDDRDIMESYATDYSGADPLYPDVVVRAQNTQEVEQVLRIANELRVPVTPRGLGSGKSGGALPLYGGIVLSLEKMTRIHEINKDDMVVVADPGVVLADLMEAVEAEQLFYPPDPNSLKLCSIGGNVACNAGGPRALKYGVTKNYVLGMQAVLPTGQAMDMGKRTLKHVTGYDLSGLMIGSEGTLGVITQVCLKLIPRPKSICTALISFKDAQAASTALTKVFLAGVVPRTMEFLDHNALAAIRDKNPGLFPDNAGALLIAETDAATEELAFSELSRAAEQCISEGALDVRVAQDEAQREKIWAPRRVLSMTLKATADRKISEDIVVPRSHIPAMLAETEDIAQTHGVRVAAYGHAGDGNLHVNVLFDGDQEKQGHAAITDLLQRTVKLGGTLSGEHGIGLLKRDYLPLEHPPAKIALQRSLKKTLDPLDILNPGKILPLEGKNHV